MPNVGLLDAANPVPPANLVSVRYSVEVDGLPVYTELYDVKKLAEDLETDRSKAIEAWTRRLLVPVHARHEPRFSAVVTGGLHPPEDVPENSE